MARVRSGKKPYKANGVNDDGSKDVRVIKSPFLYDTLFDDQSMTAGEELGVMVSTEGFGKVFVMAHGEATFDVYSAPSPNASITMAKETLLSGIAANTGETTQVTKLAPNLYVTLKNTSAGTAKFNLWVYGV